MSDGINMMGMPSGSLLLCMTEGNKVLCLTDGWEGRIFTRSTRLMMNQGRRRVIDRP